MKTVGIYAGHGTQTNGVFDSGTTYGDYTEAYFAKLITVACVDYLKDKNVKVLTDVPTNKMNMVMQTQKSNSGKADIHISVHLDWYKAPKGTLPLYVSEKGRTLASTLNKYVLAGTSLTTRGLGKRTDLYELNYTDMPACIFEVGSIKNDLSTIKKEYKKIGQALGKGICAYFGVKVTTTTTKWTPKKLTVDGWIGPESIKAWQHVMRKSITGKVKGQDKDLMDKHFPNFIFTAGINGDTLIKAWQKKIGVTQDGIVGVKTAKKTQKFLKVTQDGICGVKTAKALQKWLNDQMGYTTTTTTAKTVSKTKGELASDWAIKTAKSGLYRYKKWNSKDRKTQICPICNKLTGKYKGFNCIGFVAACYWHGANVRTHKCSMSGFGDNRFFDTLTEARWKARNGSKWKEIKNTKASNLKKGDVLICYKKSNHKKYIHFAIYVGNGKYADSTSGRTPNVGIRNYSSLASRYYIRVFRYGE